MQQNDKKRYISWKTMKYMAQFLSVGVIVFVVILSLMERPSDQAMQGSEQNCSVPVQNKVENSGASAILNMQNAKVVTTEDTRVIKRERVENTEQDSVEKWTEINENGTMAGDESLFASTEKVSSGNERAARKNRVVQTHTADKVGNLVRNRVVKNPEPSKLVSKLFENYGEKPIISDSMMTLFQYPVELGYSTDSNYDGKLMQKNTILNFTVDTSTEEREDSVVLPEENSDVGEAGGEVVAKEDSKEEIQATSEEIEKESTVESDVREQFKQEIWREIMDTEPVDVNITAEESEGVVTEEKSTQKFSDEQEMVETPEMIESVEIVTTEEVVGESETRGDTTETSEEKKPDAITAESETKTSEEISIEMEKPTSQEDKVTEEEPVVADNTFFIIKGKMRTDYSVFVDDIVITPVGKDGFNKVRLGENGDFEESITITEDAMNKKITLYFTDGETVTTGISWEYSKDETEPELILKKDSYYVLESDISKIYCTNELSLDIDMNEDDRKTTNIHYIYGDKLIYITDEDVKPTLQKDFFGRIMMSGKDFAGNVSEMLSEYFLVEQNAPMITFSQDEFCTFPYSLWVQAEDVGPIISGIRDIVCTVNGEERYIDNVETLGKVILDEGLEVPSNILFPITFEEEGTYLVQITVTDHVGNVTTQERMLEVKKPELVSVYMPEKFTIHIDPQQLAGRDQIFSDAIELKNVSEFDVEVSIDSVILKVNDEVSSEAVIKDCELYLVAPDTGEKIKISKGSNEDVYTYCLPMGAEGNIANLKFVGVTTDGSERLWKGSDIAIEMKLSFRKWNEE